MTLGLWLAMFTFGEITIGVFLQEPFWFRCATWTGVIAILVLIVELLIHNAEEDKDQ